LSQKQTKSDTMMVNDKIGVMLNYLNKQIKITVLQREGS